MKCVKKSVDLTKHHKNHRKRLRERYLNNGIDTFTECEILEMILFYGVPRKDTKPLAHHLLNRFGSVSGIFDACEQELAENGAPKAFLFFRRFFNDLEGYTAKQREVKTAFADYDHAGRYFCDVMKDCGCEKILAVMLDAKNRYIGETDISGGSFEGIQMNMEKLVQQCLERKAAKVIVAHNHPFGKSDFSTDDYITTRKIRDVLGGINVKLVEHYIISGNSYAGVDKADGSL